MRELFNQLSPLDVTACIKRFPRRYVQDWRSWIEVSTCFDSPETTSVPPLVAKKFEETLWNWRACGRFQHPRNPEQLSQILNQALPFLHPLRNRDLRSFAFPTDTLKESIRNLWSGFRKGLCEKGSAQDVAITKALLLTTRGRVGPAFDSNVRSNASISGRLAAESLITVLSLLAKQLAEFENRYSVKIEDLVPPEIGPVAVGRAMDMLLGPKSKG